MKATTHTEVYRNFEGELRPRPLRFLTIAWSGIRLGFRRKLPAFLLYAPVIISCIVSCVMVHLSFAMQSEDLGGPSAQLGRAMIAEQLGSVLDNIFLYIQNTAFFALIAVSWYGAGLISEDRRLGANLLYFARPITRLDYLLGKFLSAAAFGALALVVPCMMVCSIASFSSPDWSFLTEEWDKILKIMLFSSLWVATVTVVVLAVSSMVSRKTLALVGVVGFVVLSAGVSEAFAEIFNENRFTLFSLFQNFERLGAWILDRPNVGDSVGVESTLWALGSLWAVCLLILTNRVRKMEVVA